ncbi:MAG: four helix bundle protein [Sedimentisphaerales bacterium]|nr:four helix bundle protein [Sedimentisphaerales bacterium]
MKYERFEDLPVWKDAIELAKSVYELTKDEFFDQAGDLRSQIRLSSLSVSNNIAAGFEQGTTPQLLNFLYVSRGSCGQMRSMLLFAEQLPQAAHLQSQISDIKLQAESCSRQIRGWINSLQNSNTKPQRRLNENTPGIYDVKKQDGAFEQQLEGILARARTRRENLKSGIPNSQVTDLKSQE